MPGIDTKVNLAKKPVVKKLCLWRLRKIHTVKIFVWNGEFTQVLSC